MDKFVVLVKDVPGAIDKLVETDVKCLVIAMFPIRLSDKAKLKRNGFEFLDGCLEGIVQGFIVPKPDPTEEDEFMEGILKKTDAEKERIDKLLEDKTPPNYALLNDILTGRPYFSQREVQISKSKTYRYRGALRNYPGSYYEFNESVLGLLKDLRNTDEYGRAEFYWIENYISHVFRGVSFTKPEESPAYRSPVSGRKLVSPLAFKEVLLHLLGHTIATLRNRGKSSLNITGFRNTIIDYCKESENDDVPEKMVEFFSDVYVNVPFDLQMVESAMAEKYPEYKLNGGLKL